MNYESPYYDENSDLWCKTLDNDSRYGVTVSKELINKLIDRVITFEECPLIIDT